MSIVTESAVLETPALEELEFSTPFEEPAFHPSHEDVEWLCIQDLQDELLEQARHEAEMQDRLEGIFFGDDEIDMPQYRGLLA